MNYRLIFIINAIVLAVFGMLFLILSELTLMQFGTEIYVSTLFVARFFGGAMFMAGVLIWFTKDIQDAGAQKKHGVYIIGRFSCRIYLEFDRRRFSQCSDSL